MSKFKNIKKVLHEPRVILVRHGSTIMNSSDKSKDRIRGWQDIPLDAQGIKDAEKSAKKLAKIPFSIIYSSDLVRALKTGQIINEYHDVPIVTMTELRPWDLGIYHGQITANVIDEINEYMENEDKRPPQSSESFKEFSVRYISCLKKIINQAIKNHEDIIVTTHLRNLKLADGWIKAGMKPDCSVDEKVAQDTEFSPGDIFELPLKKYKQ